MGIGGDDRLGALALALTTERANRRGLTEFVALEAGAQQVMLRLPGWADVDDACGVYGLAFEEGFLDALHRFRIVLGLPEIRGREREALELALDPTLAPAEIVVRLRAAATTLTGDKTGIVVPFRR